MVEVKKKRVESFESLMRRFHKKLQQSGLLIQSRKIRYYERPKNKTKTKKEAIRKMEIRNEREYLRKTGKLKDEYPRRKGFIR